MFYLIHCDTYECVDFQAIIGIANNKQGVMEHLFNYHKYHFTYFPHETFETSTFDIQILKITEDNYNYLQNEINNNIDKINENHEKLNFTPECSNNEFLFVILNTDDKPQYDIFNKDFHKKYFNIVKKSKQLIY